MYGEIGLGATPLNGGDSQTKPAQVASPGTLFAQVTCGEWHTCGRTTTGNVYCWGRANQGQLGNGTTGPDQPGPVWVQPLSGVVDVAAGGPFGCARKADGTLWCWGNNTYGQLGTGSTGSPVSSPVQVSAVGTGVAGFDCGYYFTAAFKASGPPSCWGVNLTGQCGTGTTTSPLLVPTPSALACP